jgi:hypothetical protein
VPITIHIRTPADGSTIGRSFACCGSLTGTDQVSAQATQGSHTANGIPVIPPDDPNDDWQFNFVLPRVFVPGTVTVTATGGTGSEAQSDSVNVTLAGP